jgi:hypothetical protein
LIFLSFMYRHSPLTQHFTAPLLHPTALNSTARPAILFTVNMIKSVLLRQIPTPDCAETHPSPHSSDSAAQILLQTFKTGVGVGVAVEDIVVLDGDLDLMGGWNGVAVGRAMRVVRMMVSFIVRNMSRWK